MRKDEDPKINNKKKNEKAITVRERRYFCLGRNKKRMTPIKNLSKKNKTFIVVFSFTVNLEKSQTIIKDLTVLNCC